VIQKLTDSSGGVIGFKVFGRLTVDDTEGMQRQIEILLHARSERPIGILADLSEMHGIDLQAAWEEMRFLQKYTNHIARMAVVGANQWEEISAMFVVAAAVLQAETLYFLESEIHQAWHWVRTNKHAQEPAAPRISAPKGIWKDYIPEYLDV
jgi:hypothetical protein